MHGKNTASIINIEQHMNYSILALSIWHFHEYAIPTAQYLPLYGHKKSNVISTLLFEKCNDGYSLIIF